MGTALALVSIETRLLLCLRIATKKGVVSVLEVADRVAEEVDDGCDCDGGWVVESVVRGGRGRRVLPVATGGSDSPMVVLPVLLLPVV